MKNTLVISLIMACGAPANAAFTTGNDLHERLQKFQRLMATPSNTTEMVPHEDFFHAGLAGGFVTGIYDAGESARFCPSKPVTPNQLMDVVGQYLKNNPHLRQRDAHALVKEALGGAFPCKR